MKKTVIVNIYHFIRMSHEEPSRFLDADFDTLAMQIQLLKQYGLPSTYALKYDALMEPRYQRLLLEHTDENDEIAAWWEITKPLCDRAGVKFRGKPAEEFDERVDSAYSVGYEPSERIRLVDAYMKDFHSVFGCYPFTIGSWVIDSVTLAHASEHYGVTGGAICRDQPGTDGFTLWGGYPNGIYFPSRLNEFMPAQSLKNQLPVAMFRLLSPDPVYSFEQDVRDGLSGVYTLEPCCQNGRDLNRISWFFSCLTKEDSLGIGYAQVGQENNFLWENIRPGFEPQLRYLKSLSEKGLVRIETMEESAGWFSRKYAATPPLSFQASSVWNPSDSLSAQWYACRNYRIGFLAEDGFVRIRDWFLYDEAFPSRYLKHRLHEPGSTFDALPLLFAQKWISGNHGIRPFVRLLAPSSGTGTDWEEPSGCVRFYALDEQRAAAELTAGDCGYLFTMDECCLTVTIFQTHPEAGVKKASGNCFALSFDCLPVFKSREGDTLLLRHEGFDYHVRVLDGIIQEAGRDSVLLYSQNGVLRLLLAQKKLHGGRLCAASDSAAGGKDALNMPAPFSAEYLRSPDAIDSFVPRWITHKSSAKETPPFAPSFFPADSVFTLNPVPQAKPDERRILLSVPEEGARIYYTTDGTDPDEASCLYQSGLQISGDMILTARSFLPDGRASEAARSVYRFGYHDVTLKSGVKFDRRPVFSTKGVSGLLSEARGSLDYQDGRWLATLENLDFTCRLPGPRFLSTVALGFLSCHRSGIIYPQALELYLGDCEDCLALDEVISLPCAPAGREIEKTDIAFHPRKTVCCLRIVARRYEKMPQWCCYKGVPNVFTLVDNLILS